MREPDSLDALLREWKSPEPTAELDQRVTSAYRSAVRPPRSSAPVWRQFWTMRVSVPAPALVVAALVDLHPVLLVAAVGGSGGVTRNVRCRDPAERQRISTVTEWRGTGSPGHGGSEMKKSAFALVFLTALAAVLHADSQHILRASFPDGTGLEIFTETTGSSQIDSQGEMGIGPGVGSQDLVNRVVLDRANNILFVYNLEASRGASPGTVKIRIEPISAATEAGMLKYEASPGRPRFPAHTSPRLRECASFRP